MKNLESNKIFAAILVAGIIAMFSGFAADILTSTHGLEKNAVEIEGSDGAVAPVAKKAGLPEPVLALIASADIERGKKVSKACAACHSFTKDGRAGVGPNLWNIVGASKQAKEGFSYSGKLNQQGGDVWSYAELNKFLYKPKKYAAGTKMNFIGLKKATDRASIIAWLRTLADTPVGLPNAVAIDAENAKLLLAPVEDIIDVLEEKTPTTH